MSAITKRNEWLVENSDMLVAYVIRDIGGAATCLRYAEKPGIQIEQIDRENIEKDGIFRRL